MVHGPVILLFFRCVPTYYYIYINVFIFFYPLRMVLYIRKYVSPTIDTGSWVTMGSLRITLCFFFIFMDTTTPMHPAYRVPIYIHVNICIDHLILVVGTTHHTYRNNNIIVLFLYYDRKTYFIRLFLFLLPNYPCIRPNHRFLYMDIIIFHCRYLPADAFFTEIDSTPYFLYVEYYPSDL